MIHLFNTETSNILETIEISKSCKIAVQFTGGMTSCRTGRRSYKQ